MKFKSILYAAICLLISSNVYASSVQNVRLKFSSNIALTPSISIFIAASSNACGYDSNLKRIFFRGPLSKETYHTLLKYLPEEENRKKVDILDQMSERIESGSSGDLAIFMPIALAFPPVTFGISAVGIGLGIAQSPVTTVVQKDFGGKVTSYRKSNEQFVWQPMALINAVFWAVNLNPWISFVGNGVALYTFLQNDPIPQFISKAFTCDVFDKALYHSSLMSEELWAEFKLIGYFNDKDQLSDKFFSDYKEKKLVIPSQFEPYKEGICLAFDEYLSKKDTKVFGK